ncbi:MAG TPA: serine--tRNA ligase [Candidatus Binataceae bacterium]|nr:serine--tRNA ligase [Candidatus Binataceae bacterium]
MLDIKLIREQPELVRTKLTQTGADPAEVDRVLEADARRRKLQRELDEMRAQRTRESKELASASAEARDAKRAQMRELGEKISAGERDLAALENECERVLLWLPNLPRDYVPVGKDDSENKIARTEGEPQKFTSFEPKPHWELGEKLGIIDFDRGVKLSGTRFHFLLGAGARLERALIAWMLDVKTKEQKYLEVAPPLMVNTTSVTGSAHLPKFEDTMYRDKDEDFWFIPTAEVPLTNMYAREILDADRLPIYLTAYTPCFRREKMSAGRDVRGIKRGHQFDKVEMVKVVHPATSDEELERLVEDACEICRRLEIPFRVIQMCTGDLGFSAAAKYDVEMWAPGVREWLEVSSCSNCWDFQARRAQIRFREKGGKPEFVHTLNGSGLGLPRTLIAVMENYQNEDGSITIPPVLRPYMGGIDRISIS